MTITSDNGLYELAALPTQSQGEVKDSSVDRKKGSGHSAIFVARNRFAVLNKTNQVCLSHFSSMSQIVSTPFFFYVLSLKINQLIKVCDLANSVIKSIKPLVQTNEIFYGGTASLILSST